MICCSTIGFQLVSGNKEFKPRPQNGIFEKRFRTFSGNSPSRLFLGEFLLGLSKRAFLVWKLQTFAMTIWNRINNLKKMAFSLFKNNCFAVLCGRTEFKKPKFHLQYSLRQKFIPNESAAEDVSSKWLYQRLSHFPSYNKRASCSTSIWDWFHIKFIFCLVTFIINS